MQLSRIINGWGNYITEDPKIEELASKRAPHCVGCKHNKESVVFAWVKDDINEVGASVCNACDSFIKCPIAMKVRSINEKCPKGKW